MGENRSSRKRWRWLGTSRKESNGCRLHKASHEQYVDPSQLQHLRSSQLAQTLGTLRILGNLALAAELMGLRSIREGLECTAAWNVLVDSLNRHARQVDDLVGTWYNQQCVVLPVIFDADNVQDTSTAMQATLTKKALEFSPLSPIKAKL